MIVAEAFHLMEAEDHARLCATRMALREIPLQRKRAIGLCALRSDTLNTWKVLAMSVSDIMFSKEVEKEVRLSAPTIWRMQKAGLFPRYFKLSPKKNAAHRSEIMDWKRDPQAWAKRNEQASGEAAHG